MNKNKGEKPQNRFTVILIALIILGGTSGWMFAKHLKGEEKKAVQAKFTDVSNVKDVFVVL